MKALKNIFNLLPFISFCLFNCSNHNKSHFIFHLKHNKITLIIFMSFTCRYVDTPLLEQSKANSASTNQQRNELTQNQGLQEVSANIHTP